MITSDQTYAARKPAYYTIFGAAFMLTAAVVLLNAVASADQQAHLLDEGGFIETLSVVGYILCLGLLCAGWSSSALRARWYFPAVLMLFALRELDLDKALFTVGLLKSRQYTSDLVSTPEWLLSIGIVIFILTTIVVMVARESRGFISGMRAATPASLATFAGILLIAITKSVDGLGRKLAGFDIEISRATTQLAGIAEEVGELGIPVMFATAIVFAQSSFLTRKSNG